MHNAVSCQIVDASEFAFTSGTLDQANPSFRTISGGELRLNVAGTYSRIDVSAYPSGGGPSLESGTHPLLNVTQLYVAFDFKAVVIPAAADEIIAMTWNQASNYILQLRLTSGGKLRIYDQNQVSINIGPTTLSAGTYYRIEFKSVVGAAGAYEVRVNGVSEISGTCDQGTNNIGSLSLIAGLYGQTVDFRYKNIIIDDAAYPVSASVAVAALFPSAAGTYSVWTGAYTDVDDWVSSGSNDAATTKAHSQTNTDKFSVNLQDSSVPSITGAIKSVKILASAAQTTGNNSDLALGIRTGGSDDFTADIPITVGESNYSPFALVYLANPVTSAAFTTADLDALQMAVRKGATAFDVAVTAMAVIVEYDPSGSPSPTLTVISPTHDAAGNSGTMTFTGTNLNIAGLAINTFSGMTFGAPASVTATSFTATYSLTGGAVVGAHNLTVSTDGGTSGAQVFTVDSAAGAPTVSSVTPSASYVEGFAKIITLAIVGTNLNGASPSITSVPAGWSFGTPSPNGGGTAATVALTLPASPVAGSYSFVYTTTAGSSTMVGFSVTTPLIGSSSPRPNLNGGFPY